MRAFGKRAGEDRRWEPKVLWTRPADNWLARRGILVKLLILLLMIAGAASGFQPGPELVWSIDLNSRLAEPSGVMQGVHNASAVGFSADEDWVAVSLGAHLANSRSTQHLVVVRRASPSDVRQFDFESQPGVERLAWSSNGSAIALQTIPPLILRIADGTFCEIPDGRYQYHRLGGSVDGVFVFFTDHEVEGLRYVSSRISLYDSECHRIREDVVRPWVRALDVADSARPLIAIAFDQGGGSVLDARTKSVIASIPAQVHLEEVRFVDGGRTLCGTTVSNSGPPWCLDVGAEKVYPRPKMALGRSLSTAASGTSLLAADIKYSRSFFTENETWAPRKIVTLDYRTGKILASWDPSFQRKNRFGLDIGRATIYSFAISTSGRYAAEAGDGKLNLYRLPEAGR